MKEALQSRRQRHALASSKYYYANKKKAQQATAAWKRKNSEKVKVSNRVRYRKNRERVLICQAKYRNEHREECLLATRRWREKNMDYVRAYDNARTASGNPVLQAKRQRYRDGRRRALLVMFGGKCARCGFDDPRALQLDHVNGCKVSVKDRRKFGEGGITLYNKVLKGERDRKEFQLLCANCNWIKRAERNEGFKNQKGV